MENNWRFYDEKSERYADSNGRLGFKEKTTHEEWCFARRFGLRKIGTDVPI